MRRFHVLAIPLLSLLLGAAGVAQTQNNKDRQSTQLQQGNNMHSRGSDWLQREVRHELVMLNNYSVFDNLAYKIDGDRVTLLGQVSMPSLKSDAEAAVKHIEGVSAVDNQIEVLPNSPSDDRLRLAIYREIFSESGLFRYGVEAVPSVHIIVKAGHVTLEGVVDTEADKNIAFMKANGVSGVFSVTNNLRVASQK